MSRRSRLRTLAAAAAGALVLSLAPATAASADTVEEYEPNDSLDQAEGLALGDTLLGDIDFLPTCEGTDYHACDVFRIEVPFRGRLVVDLQLERESEAFGPLEFAVRDQSGAPMYVQPLTVADRDGNRLRGLAMYVNAGVYYLSLTARITDQWEHSKYSLTATLIPIAGPVETEPNGTVAAADALLLDETIVGSSFSSDCDGGLWDCDYFRVPVPEAMDVAVDFRFPCDLPPGATYQLLMLDAAQMVVQWWVFSNTDCDGLLVRDARVPVPAGDLFVLVKARAGGTTFGEPYSLAVRKLAFVDVRATHQFFDPIAWMAEAGVSTGYDIGGGRAEYRPSPSVTRDAMAAFLYRAEGSPGFSAPPVSPFVDVDTAHPFYKEITWLASRGISTGWDVGGGKREFRPLAPIARDAMAAFLFRAVGPPSYAPSSYPFLDVPSTHAFAAEIAWMAENGISTGWDVPGGKQYRPYQPVARDAMAAFLYRVYG